MGRSVLGLPIFKRNKLFPKFLKRNLLVLCTVVTDTSFYGQALFFKVDVLPVKSENSPL